MDKLIEDIENGIREKKDFVKSIKYPKMLLKNLKELRATIGNDTTKDEIALQLQHVIATKTRNDRNNTANGVAGDNKLMLHSLLYGPPGVGKTTIGTYLARIWYSIGYLEGKETVDVFEELGMDKNGGMEQWIYLLVIVFYTLLIVGMIISYVFSAAKFCYNMLGATLFFVALFILMTVIIIALFYYYYYYSGYYNYNHDTTLNNNHKNGNNNPTPNIQTDADTIEIPDTNIISIVSGEDFTGKYLGWSEKITLKLLKDNIGKVLFIDEAYSIITDMRDAYGIKALSVINRFMSEHPGEIIIIMAGYKDKIEEGLFVAQPGLKRRFMWSFDLPGYSVEELYLIWKKQLSPLNNEQSEERKVFKLFTKNKDSFPNFAGDTERLVNYVKLNHTNRMMSDKKYDEKIVTYEDIEKGLEMLKRNTIKQTPKTEEQKLREIMSKYM